jgi:hypothetical protein
VLGLISATKRREEAQCSTQEALTVHSEAERDEREVQIACVRAKYCISFNSEAIWDTCAYCRVIFSLGDEPILVTVLNKIMKLVNTCNWSVISNSYTLQFTTTQIKSFLFCCVFTGCHLVTASNVVDASVFVFHPSVPRWQIKVTLRLTVSQSVCLGVKPNLGLLTRDIFFLVQSYGLVSVGRPL